MNIKKVFLFDKNSLIDTVMQQLLQESDIQKQLVIAPTQNITDYLVEQLKCNMTNKSFNNIIVTTLKDLIYERDNSKDVKDLFSWICTIQTFYNTTHKIDNFFNRYNDVHLIADVILESSKQCIKNNTDLCSYYSKYTNRNKLLYGNLSSIVNIYNSQYIDEQLLKFDKTGTIVDNLLKYINYNDLKKIVFINPIQFTEQTIEILQKIESSIQIEIWIQTNKNNIKSYDDLLQIQNNYQNIVSDKITPESISVYNSYREYINDLLILLEENKNVAIVSPNPQIISYLKNYSNKLLGCTHIYVKNTTIFLFMQKLIDFLLHKKVYHLKLLIENYTFLNYLVDQIDELNAISLLEEFNKNAKSIQFSEFEDITKINFNNTNDQLINKAFQHTLTLLSYDDSYMNIFDFLQNIIKIVCVKQIEQKIIDSVLNMLSDVKKNILKDDYKQINKEVLLNTVLHIASKIIINTEHTIHDKQIFDFDVNSLNELLWIQHQEIIFVGMNEGVHATLNNDTIMYTPESNIIIKYLFQLIINRDYVKTKYYVDSQDIDGKYLNPSPLLYLCDQSNRIDVLKKLFSKEGAPVVVNASLQEHRNETHYPFLLKPRLIDNPVNRISATAINQYLDNPLLFYMIKCLGMSRKNYDPNDMRPNELGSVYHYIIESIMRYIIDNNILIEDDYPRKKDKIELDIKQQIDQNLIINYKSNNLSRFQGVLFDCIRNTAFYVINDIINNCLAYDWVPESVERKLHMTIDENIIKNWVQDDSIELKRSYILNGQIDRIDINRFNKNKIRIIDYKTSKLDEILQDRFIKKLSKFRIEKCSTYKLFKIDHIYYEWKDLQLLIYYILLDNEYPNKDIECAYTYILHGNDTASVTKTWNNISDYIKYAKQNIAKIIVNIDKKIFIDDKCKEISRKHIDFNNIFPDYTTQIIDDKNIR